MTHVLDPLLSANTFSNLTSLETLYISGNKLKIIQSDLFKNCIKLEKLYLGGNPIVYFSIDALENLVNLELLQISSITRKSSERGKYSMEFTFIGAMFRNLRSLKNIYMTSNYLTTIESDVFSNLLAIEEIDLSRNKLPILPDDLFSGLRVWPLAKLTFK